MSNDSQPEVHEICRRTEVCFQIDPEPVVRETSLAKAEVVTNQAEAQKSEKKKKATLTMRNAKQKEKAEITNKAERRGKILPRRQAAKGSGLIDMEFDFISEPSSLILRNKTTVRYVDPSQFCSILGRASSGSLWAKKTSKENLPKKKSKRRKDNSLVPSERGLRTM